jgi:hypothetical protein
MQSIILPKRLAFQHVGWARCSATLGVALLFVLVYIFSYPRNWDEKPVFTSPRENIGYLLVERAVEGNGFAIPLAHYDVLPPDVQLALTPRDAAAAGGNVLPKDFAGTMLLHALLFAVSPQLILLVSPLFGVASAWVASKIAANVLGRDLGPLSFAFLLTLPPLWINSAYVFMGDSAALFFLMVAVLFLVSYWQNRRWQDLVLVSVAGSISVLFRYPTILLLPVFMIALIVGRRLNLRHVGLAALAGIPAAATLLAFDWWTYGAPTTTGFSIGSRILAQTANISEESLVKVRPEIVWSYVQDYGIRIGGPGIVHVQIMFPAVLLGLASSAWWLLKGNSPQRLLAAISLGFFLILGFYYGNQDAWGLGETWVSASVLRYLLPALVLASVFFCHAILRACRFFEVPALAGVLAVVALMAGNAVYTYDSPGGIRSNYDVVERFEIVESELLAATEPDAIIATRQLDKILFPKRQTLTLTYALNNAEPVSKGDRQTWDLVPGPERFADVAAAITARGIPFYVVPDRFLAPITDYDEALNARGLHLVRISGVESQAVDEDEGLLDKGAPSVTFTQVAAVALFRIEALPEAH